LTPHMLSSSTLACRPTTVLERLAGSCAAINEDVTA
jgi:hypothetical protein